MDEASGSRERRMDRGQLLLVIAMILGVAIGLGGTLPEDRPEARDLETQPVA